MVLATSFTAAAPAAGSEPETGGLPTAAFVAPADRAAVSSPIDPLLIARSRTVELAPDLIDRLSGSAGTIVFNLFPDVAFTAVGAITSRRGPQSFSWRGSPADGAGDILLVVDEGEITGHISVPGASYEIRPRGSELHTVVALDARSAVGETHAIEPEVPAPPAPPPVTRAAPDTVDVMVVWTPAARSAAGGTAEITALITLMVDQTNTAFENSGIAHGISLIHTEEVAYTEAADALLDLDTLTCDGPSYPWLTCPDTTALDEVHDLRDAYGADLVTLIVDRPAFAGIAWTLLELNPGYQALGFAVVDVDAATTNYSFAHEIGHNYGAGHDRSAAEPGPASAAHPYAAGHISDGFFRTVMAYADGCAAECPRMLQFSNPDLAIGIGGPPLPTGSSDPTAPEDNARVVDEFFGQVGSYRYRPSIDDTDTDGRPDAVDNCPTTVNPSQSDLDHDGAGDPCDDDDDNDGVVDGKDLCPETFDPDQHDTDGDGSGDACDDDDDDDGLVDEVDAFPLLYSVCDGLPATIMGTDGDDTIVGTRRADVVMGLGGDDIIKVRGGNDTVCAGSGADTVLGGPGDDTLWGGSGDDSIKGQAGNDILLGGGGFDRLQAGPGNDELWGGDGDDRMFGGTGNDTVHGGPGRDKIDGGLNDDDLSGDDDTDWLWGRSGADRLRGGPNSDFLYGGLGDDRLEGEAGNDRLFGEGGNDLLAGDSGRDQLRGQDGIDRVDGGPGYDQCSAEVVIDACERVLRAAGSSTGRGWD